MKVYHSLIINSGIYGFFTLSKAICEADLLSLYLFFWMKFGDD